MKTEIMYRIAVQWIAENDSIDKMERQAIGRLMTSMLVADLFKKPDSEVAGDILKTRKALFGEIIENS